MTKLVLTPGDTMIVEAVYRTGTPPSPQNFTGWTGNFAIYSENSIRPGSDEDPARVSVSVTNGSKLTMTSEGIIRIELPPSDTRLFKGRLAGKYQLRVTDSAGKSTTLISGIVDIMPSPIEDLSP